VVRTDVQWLKYIYSIFSVNSCQNSSLCLRCYCDSEGQNCDSTHSVNIIRIYLRD
jgi:hypothetical protein